MRKIIASTVLLLTAAAIASGAETTARQTVYWYISDFPPIYIFSGEDQGKGTGDERLRILFKRMPEFDHRIVQAPTIRALEAMKTEPNVCNATMLKTPERAAVLEYSGPFLEKLSNGVITLRSRFAQLKPFMNKHGDLSVDACSTAERSALASSKAGASGRASTRH
jgi:uncharacterized protein (TIGR02285 family)